MKLDKKSYRISDCSIVVKNHEPHLHKYIHVPCEFDPICHRLRMYRHSTKSIYYYEIVNFDVRLRYCSLL